MYGTSVYGTSSYGSITIQDTIVILLFTETLSTTEIINMSFSVYFTEALSTTENVIKNVLRTLEKSYGKITKSDVFGKITKNDIYTSKRKEDISGKIDRL